MIRVKRIYEDSDATDGFRVLVDRLWPRGRTKEQAELDCWLKDVAPSDDLRRRFHGGVIEFDAFAVQYRRELDENPQVDELRDLLAAHERLTLLYGCRDEVQNHAVVLRDWLSQNLGDTWAPS